MSSTVDMLGGIDVSDTTYNLQRLSNVSLMSLIAGKALELETLRHMPNSLFPKKALEETVKLNRESSASKVARHPLGTVLEYPETNTSAEKQNYVAHIIDIDTTNGTWKTHRNGIQSTIAYALGSHGGKPKKQVALLVNENGELVDCQEDHWRCEWCICRENTTYHKF
jgi:hypothetical protein